MIIRSAPKDLGGFTVRRALPNRELRGLGPFVFVDHMGPSTFPPAGGISVRPHPHIGLATVTYLYEGEILHRDSVGSEAVIRPGAINWMTAGRGIAHSERMTPKSMAEGGALHGLQLWVALPEADQEIEPGFRHYPADELPTVTEDGIVARVLVGEAMGKRSPVETRSAILFVDVRAEAGATFAVPEAAERGVYVAEGVARVGDEVVEGPCLVVLQPGPAKVTTESAARLAVLGGDALDGPRHIWWNFVSTSQDRIEQAKRDWKEGRFAEVPGDEEEFIPLPE
jgi:redox-sensitive bicupin YhaK (pirin superfamily)